MKKVAISIRRAARRPLTHLVPEGRKTCTGRELAAALAGAELSPAESRAWSKDIAAGRKTPRKQPDKWQ